MVGIALQRFDAFLLVVGSKDVKRLDFRLVDSLPN